MLELDAFINIQDSINFRNPAPTYNECNSFYKLAQDPLYNAKLRGGFYSSSFKILPGWGGLNIAIRTTVSDNLDAPFIMLPAYQSA
ncbi:MAG: hypothetical protein QX203_03885 [Methylococcaceae bacterium]